ncbi:MAG: rRNA maturation RNase YbeY [Candidatus Marinimicrobia bacterium]|nr:rRNA maturation RNase YbeY [Candidatus Neomarinimicrobiota bacterium]
MQIEVFNPDPLVDVSLINSSIELVFAGEKHELSFVNVIFMGHEELRKLKQEYFKLDVYTDVIAFNLNEPGRAIEGEIYLSMDQIKLNATQYKTDLHAELYRVLIHGCLHLCGHEDDTDASKQKMTKLEDHYLSMLDLSGI